ncbi:hypothetical protein J7K70_00080 [bacterium]|nr:hypothetical protein [bacterium]
MAVVTADEVKRKLPESYSSWTDTEIDPYITDAERVASILLGQDISSSTDYDIKELVAIVSAMRILIKDGASRADKVSPYYLLRDELKMLLPKLEFKYSEELSGSLPDEDDFIFTLEDEW